ncbi:YcnI family protein [Saccharopolyspora sp. NFXS83]|uniref:YcnI family copper-binding membrane protein n=1 Tax=Saccharopolyspora sp. NFXS83 TaxID=2993560 RepID=UPI00224B9A80|nr:YcnI family protein [Saccharopolyspora sp. NFXS83]MCX2731240.1 YcnI family protein [Saccharopolyspora sp. NFXS83]
MSTTRSALRSTAVTAVLGFTALAGAGTAAAHVSAQPEQAEQGGYAKIAFRVPNERPDAGTVRVHVALPLEHPLSSVRTKPLPGWTAQVEKVRLERPVEVAGAQVTEAVAGITWTARPGTRIAPDQFEEFEATLGTFPTDTDELLLPTEQTYDSGEVVRWDQPPAPDGSEPEHPAPALALVASEGGGHGHGTTGGGDTGHGGAGHGEADAAAADDTARVLGGTGLAVGALGLGLGAGALVLARRGTKGNA